MDKYIDMLKEAKEGRILEILEETENFLREIGIRIHENKGNNTLGQLKNNNLGNSSSKP